MILLKRADEMICFLSHSMFDATVCSCDSEENPFIRSIVQQRMHFFFQAIVREKGSRIKGCLVGRERNLNALRLEMDCLYSRICWYTSLQSLLNDKWWQIVLIWCNTITSSIIWPQNSLKSSQSFQSQNTFFSIISHTFSLLFTNTFLTFTLRSIRDLCAWSGCSWWRWHQRNHSDWFIRMPDRNGDHDEYNEVFKIIKKAKDDFRSFQVPLIWCRTVSRRNNSMFIILQTCAV